MLLKFLKDFRFTLVKNFYCSSDLNAYGWFKLVLNKPELAPFCPYWDTFSTVAYVDILCKHPILESYIIWQKLDGVAWVQLLLKTDRYDSKVNWDKLSGHDWVWLMKRRNGFESVCDWSKLSERDFNDLFDPNYSSFAESLWGSFSRIDY